MKCPSTLTRLAAAMRHGHATHSRVRGHDLCHALGNPTEIIVVGRTRSDGQRVRYALIPLSDVQLRALWNRCESWELDPEGSE